MSIEKGDATKYVHTGNGELCYELNKALTVPETFPIYLSSRPEERRIWPMVMPIAASSSGLRSR